jgi:hypothetical protein
VHLDDLVVAKTKGLRPLVTVPVLVRPGERDDDALSARLNRIEAVVVVTGFASFRDASAENRTGLQWAVSGGGRPEARQTSASTPLHLRVDQRDERLDVAVAE